LRSGSPDLKRDTTLPRTGQRQLRLRRVASAGGGTALDAILGLGLDVGFGVDFDFAVGLGGGERLTGGGRSRSVWPG
jgi:hypothetical protein